MFSKVKGYWLILLIGAMPFYTFASPAGSKITADSRVKLSIQPLTCVVRKQGDNCQMTINAKWQSDQPIDVCFFQDDQQLLCWQRKNFAAQQFDVSLNSDMIFSLKLANGELVAQQKVQVNSSSSAQYRRRLRAQWSFF